MKPGDIVNFDAMPDSAVVRINTLVGGPAPVVPYSKQSVYRLMACDKFPKSHRIGLRTAVWRVGDIRAWLNERAAAPVVPAAQHLAGISKRRKSAVLGA